MLKNGFYVDRRGNAGPMCHMVEYPVMALRQAKYGLDKPDRNVADQNRDLIMVPGKGFTPEPGYYYEFVFEVFPPTPLKRVEFQGPLKDAVGRERTMSSEDCVFCHNVKHKYNITTDFPCRYITVRTSVVLQSQIVPMRVTPTFAMVHPLDKDLSLPTLADSVFLNPDFEVIVKVSGTKFDICKAALRRSATFKRMLEFKENIDPQSSQRIVIETTEYSDEVWRKALHYMVFNDIPTDDIQLLLVLFKFGHEFQVAGMCSLVVHILRHRVEDGTFVGLNPHIVSLLAMTVYWQSLDLETDLCARLNELNRECEVAVCNRSYTLMRYYPEFMGQWHKYLSFKQQCLGPIALPEGENVYVMEDVLWPELSCKRPRA